MREQRAQRPISPLARCAVMILLLCACGSSEKEQTPPPVVPTVLPPTVAAPPSVWSPITQDTAGTASTPVMVNPAMTAGVGATPIDGTAGQSMEAAGSAASTPARPDIVFTMSGTIQAGAEAMFCMYAQLPNEETAIPSAESHYTPGSHHFLVFRTNLTEVPAGGDRSHLCGEPDTTVAVTGGANGIASLESTKGTTGSYYEAQVPDSRRDLPPGVAHVFQPGEILMLTAHYLNVTDATIESTIEFRLHTMDPKDVKEEAGTFFLLDTQLDIPPNSAVTFTQTCPIPKDLNLGILWSHMHGRGYSFRAWTDDPMAMQQLGGDVYDQPGPDGWEEPHVQNYPFDPPITLHAGSKLMFACTFHNTTSQTFRFGQSAAKNEMCLLHGMYWPRLDTATERCSNGTSSGDTPVPIPVGGM